MSLTRLTLAVCSAAPLAYARAFVACLATEFVKKAAAAHCQKTALSVMSVNEACSAAEAAQRWEDATKASRPAMRAFAVLDLGVQVGRARAVLTDDGISRALRAFDLPFEEGRAQPTLTNVATIAAAAPRLLAQGPGLPEPRPVITQHMTL